MATTHRQAKSSRPARVRAGALVVLVTALVAACGRDPATPAPPPPQLEIVRRMMDPGVLFDDDPNVAHGARVVLAGDSRLALTSARSVAPVLTCEPGSAQQPRPCTARIPDGAPPVPHVFTPGGGLAKPEPYAPGHADGTLDAPGHADGTLDAHGHADAATAGAHGETAAADARAATGVPRSRPVVLHPGATAQVGNLTPLDTMVARLLAAAPLQSRSVTSEPFTVPRGAILRLSHGVEEPAWAIDSAPVYFRVIVELENGDTQDMLRRVLDPAQRPDDRRWYDNDVDLSDLAGQKIRVRFSTEPAQEGDARPSLPVWGDPRLLAPGKRSRPSIVLVSLDTMRARSTSLYGYALDTTPFLRALAARGALFEKAFTTYSNTLPSHMSMLTGLYPGTHAVVTSTAALAPEHATLAETLRRAGYTTAAFTEDALLDARRGFWRGFSTYYEDTEIGDGVGAAESTFGRGLEWIGRHADEPFFVFLHTYQVHRPYRPPVEYQGLFTGDDAPPRDKLHQAYEQEIRYADDVMKRLVDGLARFVPDEDLILIVTADHGEEFGEHGMTSHHQLYDEVMHVPLIVVAPGRIPAGVRVATPVSLVDIAPTVLALADVPAPAGLDGMSLLPLVDGRGTPFERRAVFGEFPHSPYTPETHYVARDEVAKCMLPESGRGDFCFDLRSDPDERQRRNPQDTIALSNLHGEGDAYRRRSISAQKHAAEQRALQSAETRRSLRNVMAVHDPPHAAAAPPSDAAAAPQPTAEAPAAPAGDVERKMRALGYIE